jgi:hypothetical protein
MASLLEWVNSVRTLLDRPELPGIELDRTERDDDENCVVAMALGQPVGPSAASEDALDWVIRFDDGRVARRVGIIMGLKWRPEPPEVDLPEAVVDLAVSHHRGWVEADELGFLLAWWVPKSADQEPASQGELKLISPLDEDLLDGRLWQYPKEA